MMGRDSRLYTEREEAGTDKNEQQKERAVGTKNSPQAQSNAVHTLVLSGPRADCWEWMLKALMAVKLSPFSSILCSGNNVLVLTWLSRYSRDN